MTLVPSDRVTGLDRVVCSSAVSDSSGSSKETIVNLQGLHEREGVSDTNDILDSEVLKCRALNEETGRDVLKNEIASDDTLKACRDLADKNLNGYSWVDDILVHTLEPDNSKVERLVLPVSKR